MYSPAPCRRALHPCSRLPRRKSGEKGLWIFLIAVGVLLAVIVAAIVVSSLTDGETPSIRGDGSTDGEGGDASSIVDIFRTEKTTIPGCRGRRACP